MRILVLTNYFPPEMGAASQLFSELTESLANSGHELTVVTGFPRYRMHGRDRHGFFRREHWGRVGVIRLASSPFDRGGPLLRGLDHLYLGGAMLLGGLLAGKQDAVLAYSPPLTVGFAACALGTVRNVPSVVNVQDLFPQYAIDAGLMHNPTLIRAFRRLERFVYGHATALTVHSAGNREHAIAHGAPPARVRVISNWADTSCLRPLSQNNELSRQWGMAEKFVVEYAGTMGYQQDLGTVIEVATLLQGEHDIVFLLIGDGVARARLERTVRQRGLHNVQFRPMQSRELYPLALASASVGVVTLQKSIRTPGIPSKLFSIMASGRPTIASVSRDSDAAQLVEAGGVGIWVPPERPDLFAEALLKLRADTSLRDEMGRKARRRAETEFSRESSVGQYERLFDDLTRYRYFVEWGQIGP